MWPQNVAGSVGGDFQAIPQEVFPHGVADTSRMVDACLSIQSNIYVTCVKLSSSFGSASHVSTVRFWLVVYRSWSTSGRLAYGLRTRETGIGVRHSTLCENMDHGDVFPVDPSNAVSIRDPLARYPRYRAAVW